MWLREPSEDNATAVGLGQREGGTGRWVDLSPARSPVSSAAMRTVVVASGRDDGNRSIAGIPPRRGWGFLGATTCEQYLREKTGYSLRAVY